MTNPFKVGDKVRVVEGRGPLVQGAVHTVTQSDERFIGLDHSDLTAAYGWLAERFVKVEETVKERFPVGCTVKCVTTGAVDGCPYTSAAVTEGETYFVRGYNGGSDVLLQGVVRSLNANRFVKIEIGIIFKNGDRVVDGDDDLGTVLNASATGFSVDFDDIGVVNYRWDEVVTVGLRLASWEDEEDSEDDCDCSFYVPEDEGEDEDDYCNAGPAPTVIIPPAPEASSYHERKFDQGKSRVDLIPGEALDALGEVLAYGCAKYAESSWKLVPDAEKRYSAALGRHYAAMLRGESVDPESGKLHVEHVLTNAAFLTYFARRGGQ